MVDLPWRIISVIVDLNRDLLLSSKQQHTWLLVPSFGNIKFILLSIPSDI